VGREMPFMILSCPSGFRIVAFDINFNVFVLKVKQQKINEFINAQLKIHTPIYFVVAINLFIFSSKRK
jgi:hypothetical protein